MLFDSYDCILLNFDRHIICISVIYGVVSGSHSRCNSYGGLIGFRYSRLTVRCPGIRYTKPWRKSCRALWPSRGSKFTDRKLVEPSSCPPRNVNVFVTLQLSGLRSRWSCRSAWKTMIPRRTSVSPALSGSAFYCFTHPFPCALPALPDC